MYELELPNFINYAIPAFFLLIFLEVAIGFWRGKGWYQLSDSITDLATGVLNRLFTFFYLGFTVLIYSFFYDHLALIQWDLGSQTELWVSFSIGFVAFDFLYYWAHRMSHEMNFLWAGHVVHHQSEEFNLTVALRQPAFHQLFTWIFFLPLAFLGIHPALLVAIGEISLIYQFWIHTRAIKSLGPLEWIFNTPSHHRVHHGRNPEYIDRNHAGTFIIWDMMFGTFAREKQEPVYGIVKPFRSYDPLWANLHYWQEIWQLMKRASGIKEKVLIWFRRPGYDPGNPSGAIEIPEVSAEDYKKFRISPDKLSSVYASLWFGVVAGIALGALFLEERLPALTLLLVTAWATFSLTNLGAILQKKPHWPVAESLRLIATAALAYWLHAYPPATGSVLISDWIFQVVYALCGISLSYSIRLPSSSWKFYRKKNGILAG